MTETQPESLAELLKELAVLMEYGAPADERPRLDELVQRYAADTIVLKVLHSFYSFLPEAQDDGIVEFHRIASRKGIFLFCARSLLDDYLYLANRERAEFLGPMRDGLLPPEVLEFFGWKNQEEFLKLISDPAGLAVHQPLNENPDLCPVCGTTEGEVHTSGCPVEICPWCGGQLVHCQCRFDQTGLESFSTEAHLERFLELLERKGRVPFNAESQRPAYKSA